MDAATPNNYEAALKQAEAELARHKERGEALLRTVEALRNLLVLVPAKPAPVRRRKPRRKIVKGNHPPIPSDHFKGMGPTAAYRKFVAEFGMDHPVPSIRDALLAGDVKTKSSASLLTGLHSVRQRDAQKEEIAEKKKAAEEAERRAAEEAERKAEETTE